MVNRMKEFLCTSIADYQNAFVLGRHMEDNVLISKEVRHFINKQCRGMKYLAALKLDMNKVYDRVRWIFLLKILTAYNFPADLVR